MNEGVNGEGEWEGDGRHGEGVTEGNERGRGRACSLGVEGWTGQETGRGGRGRGWGMSKGEGKAVNRGEGRGMLHVGCEG